MTDILMEQIEKDINNLNEDELRDTLLGMIDSTYMYVSWPEVQDLMDKEWFEDEAILDVENDSSYLIPTKYILITQKEE